jgi:hypothetical protein
MRRPIEKSPGLDISNSLAGWNYQPGEVNVRLIRGDDGRQKIQLRLDLGLLQMETTGRPDGKRPHNCASELNYQLNRKRIFERKHESAARFQLSHADVRALRDETGMYYHRYVSFFVLGNYKAVIRDTQHNLDALDLCKSSARNPHDRQALEHHRPHALMMQGRARACAALKQGYLGSALAFLRGALKQIEQCLSQDGRHPVDLKLSAEARILMHLIQDVKRQLPTDPREELQQLLSKALENENFEEAAALRDQIMAMQTMVSMARPAEPAKTRRRDRNNLPRRSDHRPPQPPPTE